MHCSISRSKSCGRRAQELAHEAVHPKHERQSLTTDITNAVVALRSVRAKRKCCTRLGCKQNSSVRAVCLMENKNTFTESDSKTHTARESEVPLFASQPALMQIASLHGKHATQRAKYTHVEPQSLTRPARTHSYCTTQCLLTVSTLV
jgi:hypothetical protein